MMPKARNFIKNEIHQLCFPGNVLKISKHLFQELLWSTTSTNLSQDVVRCTIWYHLSSLKNVKNTHGGVLILVKLQALACTNVYRLQPLQLYKWYQISQRTTYGKNLLFMINVLTELFKNLFKLVMIIKSIITTNNQTVSTLKKYENKKYS